MAVVVELFSEPVSFVRGRMTSAAATGQSAVGHRRAVMVCGGDARHSHVMLTQSHLAIVEMTNPKMIATAGTFLLHYAGWSTSLYVTVQTRTH